jgi:hypothetical protein
MAATIAAQARSASTLPRLKPSRSTMGPLRTEARTDPIPIAAPVRPVLTALPVVTRTNQGTATVVMLFPTEERCWLRTGRRSGPGRRRCVLARPVLAYRRRPSAQASGSTENRRPCTHGCPYSVRQGDQADQWRGKRKLAVAIKLASNIGQGRNPALIGLSPIERMYRPASHPCPAGPVRTASLPAAQRPRPAHASDTGVGSKASVLASTSATAQASGGRSTRRPPTVTRLGLVPGGPAGLGRVSRIGSPSRAGMPGIGSSEP